MSSFKLRSQLFFTLSSFAILSACEIGTEKREVVPDDGVVISYFFSNQYAINHTNVREFFSNLYGGIGAAGPDSKMELWEEPPIGCFLTVAYDNTAVQEIALRKRVDAGQLQLQSSAKTEDFVKSAGLTYSYDMAMASGTYSILSPGLSSGILAFEQSFEVLPIGGNIRVSSTLDQGSGPVVVDQNLASPEVPAPTDSDYRVIFNRMSDSFVNFDAPVGTDYIRVNLKDGSNTNGGDVTCFGRANEPLKIARGALFGFRTGNQGHMEVDFVKVHKVTNIPKVKYLSLISTMRHFQGTFEYTTTDNVKVTENVGIIEFR